jgi:M-phase inducer tyrosine phosphatase
MTRPVLSRIKGLSTSTLVTRSAGFDVPPPFRFGNIQTLPPTTTAAMEECFIESPDSSSFPSPLRSPIGPRPKSSHHRPSFGQASSTGSPIACSIKKPSPSLHRPRKQFRRSLSMFEHPIDVLNQQQQEQKVECGLQSIMDFDETPQHQLPHFLPEQDTIPRITKETMIDVLDGKYNQTYDNSMVIDCRFEYEYKGGHIEGAINFNDKEELARRLFDHATNQKTLLIFHCEYSAHRAPIA